MAEIGVSGLCKRPVFYASDQAHDSFIKIARITGLGSEALRPVRSDARQRMDIADLHRQIAADHARGDVPFLIVTTIGTTATAAITVKLDGGVCWLRACITHHEVTADDITALVGALNRARRLIA